MRNHQTRIATGMAIVHACCIAFVMSAAPAMAQRISRDDEARFAAYLDSEELVTARADFVQWLVHERDQKCATAPAFERQLWRGDAYFLYEDRPVLDFPAGQDQPTNAVWFEVYEIAYCGVTEPATARFEVSDGNLLRPGWAPPGETRLTIEQVNRYWHGIAQAAYRGSSLRSRCSFGSVPVATGLVTTVHAGGPMPFNLPSATTWDEVWTIRMCGFYVPITLRFERERESDALEVSEAYTSLSPHLGAAGRIPRSALDPQTTDTDRGFSILNRPPTQQHRRLPPVPAPQPDRDDSSFDN